MLLYDDRTRAEIDLDALENNFRILKGKTAPGTRIMTMVKADAYGHGATPVARELEKLGVDYLGVANIYEAAALREAGISCPILILGYTPFELTGELLRFGVTQTVQSLSHAEAYAAQAKALGKTLRVHIKLDTGMSRCGIVCAPDPDAAAREAAAICALDALDAEGIFTHFASSETLDGSYTMTQYAVFSSVLDKICAAGINIPIKHCANSAAVLKYPYMHMDMVRLGLALYGYSPLEDGPDFGLIPVMRLCTRIEQLKILPAGTKVSYGMTFTTKRETKLAVLPIGYGDGLRRVYQDMGAVVRGVRAPQIGRVCMDLCMLDVTDVPGVQEGDRVVLFGAPPFPTADVFAAKDNVSPYELLTGVSKRVLRLYQRSGETVERMCYV